MRRLPLASLIVVALAVAAMIALGAWQIARGREKRVLIARYEANIARPPVPFVSLWPIGEDALFRRVTATCPAVQSWRSEAGRSADGRSGWRHIALCGTGAEGPGLAIDLGVSDAATDPQWAGGAVSGRLTWAPDAQPLVARLFGAAPPHTPMVVAETPAPGLRPGAQPDPASEPNNHLSYAIQWFLFAGTALVVYVVALRRRRRSVARDGAHR